MLSFFAVLFGYMPFFTGKMKLKMSISYFVVEVIVKCNSAFHWYMHTVHLCNFGSLLDCVPRP